MSDHMWANLIEILLVVVLGLHVTNFYGGVLILRYVCFFTVFFRRYAVRSILFRIFLTQGRPKNQTAQDLVLGPPKYFLFYKGIRSQKNSLNYIYIYLGLRFEHNKPSNSVGLVLACDREDAGLSHGTHVFFHL
jgi:hypothetical protein